MLVFYFGVFSQENVKIKYFARFRHQFWHSLEKMINDFFEGVRLHNLYSFPIFRKRIEIRMC